MNPRSEAELSRVIPALADKVRSAAAVLKQEGTFLLVISGLRTAAEQNALYAQGRTSPGHVVTNAKAGQSMHNYGLAVDIAPYLQGEDGRINWKPDTPQFKAMVAAMKSQGLEWGGDWKHFPDMDHFQLAGLPANPSLAMQADYPQGLDAIWDNLVAGKYSEYGGSNSNA